MRQYSIFVMMFKLQVLFALFQQNNAEDFSEHLHELSIRHILILLVFLVANLRGIYLALLGCLFAFLYYSIINQIVFKCKWRFLHLE